MKELAAKYRTELVEHVAEMDEDLMEKYFEEGEDAITVDEIKKVIRKSTIATQWFLYAAVLHIVIWVFSHSLMQLLTICRLLPM